MNQCKTSEKQQYAEQSSIDFTFQLEGWKYEHTTARMTAKLHYVGHNVSAERPGKYMKWPQGNTL